MLAIARREEFKCRCFVPDGAESPAVVEDRSRGLELVLRWAVGCHDLDEGEQESAVVVCGPLGRHVQMFGGDLVVVWGCILVILVVLSWLLVLLLLLCKKRGAVGKWMVLL